MTSDKECKQISFYFKQLQHNNGFEICLFHSKVLYVYRDT